MKLLARLAAASLTCLVPVALAAPEGFSPISVTVLDREGTHRGNGPLSFGVPFPPRTLAEGSRVALEDDAGKALPVQTRVLSRWSDGSVRWLLVDTQLDVGRGGRKTVRLRPGAAAAAAQPLRLEDAKDHVAVDTGALRFRVPKDRFAIVETTAPVELRATSVLESDGRAGSARVPEKVSVLEAGPLRARIELSGTYGNGFDYRIRIDSYAGQPFVRILHTFLNRNAAPYVGLARLAVEVPLGGAGGSRYEYGGLNGSPVSGSVGDGLGLAQLDDSAAEIDGRRREGKLPGWVQVRQDGASVGIAARWFWQEYPKGLELRPDALVYDLWASRQRAAKVGTGAAKTHELVLWAAPTMPPARAAALATPLVAAVDAGWIAASGALPMAVAPPAEGFVDKVSAAAERYLRRNESERWDDSGAIRCASGQAEVPRTGAFGMWNWGDWNFPGYHDDTKGCDAWGNLEYDTPLVLALAFAASGEPALHDAMVAAARHFMDVDRIHFYPARPSWVGMNHPKNPLHFTFELGGIDLGHTWNEGVLSYYYLTGDERGLQAALEIADYLVERIGGFVFRANPRQWGWPQVALVAAYQATHEEKYRQAALAYARRGMEAHAPKGAQRWKLGILADGLAYTHSVTGDAEIEKWLRTFATTVGRRKAPLDGRLYPAVAYVSTLQPRNESLREAARARAAKLQLGNWGKPFTINGRVGFRIYSLLGKR